MSQCGSQEQSGYSSTKLHATSFTFRIPCQQNKLGSTELHTISGRLLLVPKLIQVVLDWVALHYSAACQADLQLWLDDIGVDQVNNCNTFGGGRGDYDLTLFRRAEHVKTVHSCKGCTSLIRWKCKYGSSVHRYQGQYFQKHSVWAYFHFC